MSGENEKTNKPRNKTVKASLLQLSRKKKNLDLYKHEKSLYHLHKLLQMSSLEVDVLKYYTTGTLDPGALNHEVNSRFSFSAPLFFRTTVHSYIYIHMPEVLPSCGLV